MTIAAHIQTAIEQLIDSICAQATTGRNRRKLAEMFLDLPDKEAWPDYYRAIPEPRSINGIKEVLHNKKYKQAEDVYDDLILVMLNAEFYNEEGSQIWKDAETLKTFIEHNWKANPILPAPRTTPILASPSKRKIGSKTVAQPSATLSGPTIRILPPKAPSSSTHTGKQPVHTPAANTRPTTPAATQSTGTAPAAKPSNFAPLTKVSPQQPAPYGYPYGANPPAATAGTSQVTAQTPGAQTQTLARANQQTGKAPTTKSNEHAKPNQNGTPDPADGVDEDGKGDEHVHHLERGLPRWRGPSEDGLTNELASNLTPANIIDYIKDSKGPTLRHKSPSDSLMDVTEEPMRESSYPSPLSLHMIDTRARQDYYSSIADFDFDMVRLFEKARRFYKPATTQYGHILTCQRMYQQFTTNSPPSSPSTFSHTYFSSVSSGPGVAKTPSPSTITISEEGVPQPRISTKARKFTDGVAYKGQVYTIGDWVHLSNPDDPTRPIVAQVFRTWISEEKSKKGRSFVTVCWYFRPEQTVHTETRRFFENEVFRSCHFVDHAVEDLIEKVAVQCTSQYVKGRPRPPDWYPNWPLYVCDSIYNDIDNEHIFVKVRNWGSCLPVELRLKYPSLSSPDPSALSSDLKATYMPIYPFEQPIIPRTSSSPFLRGISGPGTTEEALEEKNDPGRRKTRRAAEKSAAANLEIARADRSDKGDRGDSIPPGHMGYYPGVTVSAKGAITTTPASSVAAKTEDRSVLTAAGGMAHISSIEKLPPETAKSFDRDPTTNEVFWFSGPPIDIPRPRVPQHSLEYLHFLARKRKREREMRVSGTYMESEKKGEEDSVSSDGMMADLESASRAKMPRKTLTQMIDDMWDEVMVGRT